MRRVNREAHAPFCGSPRAQFPRATRPDGCGASADGWADPRPRHSRPVHPAFRRPPPRRTSLQTAQCSTAITMLRR
jgi:hypothetical protein